MRQSVICFRYLPVVFLLPLILAGQSRSRTDFASAYDSLAFYTLQDTDTNAVNHWKNELSGIIRGHAERDILISNLVDSLVEKKQNPGAWKSRAIFVLADLTLNEINNCPSFKDLGCIFDTWYLYAYYLEKTGKIKESISSYHTAIGVSRQHSGYYPSREAGDCYMLMGSAYKKQGDNAQALKQYELSREEYRNAIGENTMDFSRTELMLSSLYDEVGRSSEGLALCRKVVNFRKHFGGARPVDVSSAHMNMVSFFPTLKQADSVFAHLDSARHYLLLEHSYNPLKWHEYFDILSVTLMAIGKHDQALAATDSALSIIEREGRSKSRHGGRLLVRKSEIQYARGNYPAALDLAQEALISMIPKFTPASTEDYPSAEMLTEEPWLQEALSGKATVLQKMSEGAEREERIRFLLKALEGFRLACKVVDIMRSNFESGESRTDLSSRTYTQYENAIECSQQLYELTGDRKYLADAWEFMERSKAMALLTELTTLMASQLILPDSTKLQEKALNDSIAWYSDRRALSAKGTAEYNLLHTAFVRKEEERRAFVEHLEQTNPLYYQYKYDLELEPIDSLQAHLGRTHSQLLEYFAGDSNVFVMSVKPNEIKLIRLKRHGLWEEDLDYYCEGIAGVSNFRPLPEPLQKAEQLYAELVKPLLGRDSVKLVIVPDGKLWSLPFEALVTGPAQNFGDAHYLLLDYPIQYAWSGNFLLKLPRLKLEGNQQLLAYAPSFGMNEDGERNRKFGRLTYNTQEAKAIAGLAGGELRLAAKATEKSFRDEAPLYSILHVASHAVMRKGSPDSTGIVFQQMPGELVPEQDGFLSINEMRNMRLNAELAVLSACETGEGQLVRGEGLMSLARSFTNTGCRSLVMSLWKVDDKATSIIMENFYQNLDKGMEKDIALQQAKISYLAEGNPHPTNWAAFVGIGSPESVEIKSSSNLILWLVLAGITFIILAGAGIQVSRRA